MDSLIIILAALNIFLFGVLIIALVLSKSKGPPNAE